MEKDKNKTKVVFRKWKGQIIALFPKLIEVTVHPLVSSYMHIGQHGGANYNYIITHSKPATPEEYKDLFNELESLGYNLLVQKKAKINFL